MDRRVSLDILDNAAYNEVAAAQLIYNDENDEELDVPTRGGSVASVMTEPLPPIDFSALANDFYKGKKNTVCES